MNAKKVIMKYISPGYNSLIISVVSLIGILFDPGMETGISAFAIMIAVIFFIKFLAFDMIKLSRAKKSVKALIAEGLLEQAAMELSGNYKKVFGKNKVVITQNFVFSRKVGTAVNCRKIILMYKTSNTVRYLFIPIFRMESLIIGTPAVFSNVYLKYGKDKEQIIPQLADILFKYNPDMAVGFSRENLKEYKKAAKNYKLWRKEMIKQGK